jgi:hypothetical protein
MKISEIYELALVIGTSCDVKKWMDLKKLLLNSLPPSARTNFSTRDPKTKKQSLNKFERELLKMYENKVGITLEVPIEE